MPQANVVFIGIKGSVLALDRATGAQVWRANLKGSGFVNVVIDQGELYATTQGQVYRLDPASGQVLWNNNLPGLGLGLVTIGTTSNAQVMPMREKQRQDEANAAAAGAAGS